MKGLKRMRIHLHLNHNRITEVYDNRPCMHLQGRFYGCIIILGPEWLIHQESNKM